MRVAGIDLNTVDWKEQYNGAVGSFRQELEKANASVADHQTKLAAALQKITELETSLGGATEKASKYDGLTAELDTAKKQAADLAKTTEKQKLLLEFPDVLMQSTVVGEGDKAKTVNPYLDLIMSSTASGDELRNMVATMVATFKKPGQAGGLPAPAPATTEPLDSASLKRKAVEWHEKAIASGASHDFDEEARYWKLAREAEQRESKR
jgi:hypothetical protein